MALEDKIEQKENKKSEPITLEKIRNRKYGSLFMAFCSSSFVAIPVLWYGSLNTLYGGIDRDIDIIHDVPWYFHLALFAGATAGLINMGRELKMYHKAKNQEREFLEHLQVSPEYRK